MYILLTIACIAPPETEAPADSPVEEPTVEVEAEIQGLSLGEFVDGFYVVTTDTDDAWLQVVLTTFPDPCEALTGYFEELAAALAPDPNVYFTDAWDDVERRADRAWFPADPYDTLEIDHAVAGAEPDLIGEYEMRGGVQSSGEASTSLEVGHDGFGGPYESFQETYGRAGVSALDPAVGEGSTRVSGRLDGVGEVEGTLRFTYEVPACDTYAPAYEAYEDALPDGC